MSNIPFGYNDNGQPIEGKSPSRKIIGIDYFAEKIKSRERKQQEWDEITRSFPSTPQDADILMKKMRNEQ